MKKLISAVALASMMAPAANATTARLLAFGMNETDSEGMYFIEDDRNVFLNAATAATIGNKVIIELGNEGQTLGSSALNSPAVDKDYAPKAKGGLFREFGNYTAGIYLGNESNTSALLRVVGSANATAPSLMGADNQVDLFIAGGDSLKWGANFLWSKNENKEGTNNREESAMATRFGVKADKWDAFANISLNSESEDKVAEDKFDGKLGLHLGGGYEVMEGLKAYGFIKKFDWDQIDGATTTEGGFTSWSVGVAKTWNIDQGFWFVNANYKVKDIEIKYASNPAKAENTILPISVGFEKGATSWLTLRGSITQNLMGTRNNNNYSSLANATARAAATGEFGSDTGGKDQTIGDSTDVRSGATLHFGKLHVDGLIGATTTSSAATKGGALHLDQFMYRVAMTYDF